MKAGKVTTGVSAIALLAGTLAFVPQAFAQDDDSYKLQRQAPTGSNIKRDPPLLNDGGQSLSWVIPMDKTYDELSPGERQMLRSAYEAMSETDEPPYPLHGMGKASQPVALLQQRYLAEGILLIHVRVDQSGDPLSAKIVKAPGGGIGRAVAMVLMHTKFKPAKCGDQRCEMEFPFAYNFVVK